MGMSGGVDSTVAALLLQEAGHDVVGVTMVIYRGPNLAPDSAKSGCYGKDPSRDLESARSMANRLGIEHHVIHLEDEFQNLVIHNYIEDYRNGLTPTPCVLCNRHIKFQALVEKAEEQGIDFDRVATGHYAIVREVAGEKYPGLFVARERSKDQTFFLHRIPSQTLSRVLFPLGDLDKAGVREIARSHGLEVHDRAESKGFFAGDYRDLLGFEKKAGEIRHGQTGKILGQHEGYWNFTIGQRKGLGIDTSRMEGGLFVTSTDPATNTVFVGNKNHIRFSEFRIHNPHWLIDDPTLPMDVQVKAGNTHPPVEGTLHPPSLENETPVYLFSAREPIIAIAPGQPAVFYRDDRVLGGGVIL